ncbi:MAG: ComEA family DNA-binding protein [Lachnospiraceae bacterium]|nr:ComEA family DNA-binding protein [Lachnospiraceae bacterium]
MILTELAGEDPAPVGKEGETGQVKPDEPQVNPVIPAKVVIHVCGAVNRQGVYTLDEGCRVFEAVEAAGGFSADADEDYINQAQVLADGVRLRIPTREETAAMAAETTAQGVDPAAGISGGMETGGAAGGEGKVNINTADAETLCRLNGVGPSTAAKIIAYREANGRFRAIEDIMQISGIKEKLFAKIRDDISV